MAGMGSIKDGDHQQLLHRIIIYCLFPRLATSGGGSGLLVGLAKVGLAIRYSTDRDRPCQ